VSHSNRGLTDLQILDLTIRMRILKWHEAERCHGGGGLTTPLQRECIKIAVRTNGNTQGCEMKSRHMTVGTPPLLRFLGRLETVVLGSTLVMVQRCMVPAERKS
jgi:hypothetical protein